MCSCLAKMLWVPMMLLASSVAAMESGSSSERQLAGMDENGCSQQGLLSGGFSLLQHGAASVTSRPPSIAVAAAQPSAGQRTLTAGQRRVSLACGESSQVVPRNIFMFWNQGWAPEVVPAEVAANAEGWRAANPGWTLHLLDGSNQSLQAYFNQSVVEALQQQELVQFLADVVRTLALARYGGVWADADTVCGRPLDAWIDQKVHPAGFFAFRYTEENDRLLSNWFLASTAGNYIVHQMASELLRYASGHSEPWFYYHWHYQFFLLVWSDAKFRALWAAASHNKYEDYSCIGQNCTYAPCVHFYKRFSSNDTKAFMEDVDLDCAPVYKLKRKILKLSWVQHVSAHAASLAAMAPCWDRQ